MQQLAPQTMLLLALLLMSRSSDAFSPSSASKRSSLALKTYSGSIPSGSSSIPSISVPSNGQEQPQTMTPPALNTSPVGSSYSTLGSAAEAIVERIFDVLDADGSGTIDAEELTQHLRFSEQEETDKDLRKLVDKLGGEISRQDFRHAILKEAGTPVLADLIFRLVDRDGSGTIDLPELNAHLSKAGYSRNQIRTLFDKMDMDQNGEINSDEFREAMQVEDTDCPRGYFLNSVKQTCEPLGPIGRISQKWETMGPFKRVYNTISNAGGLVDRKKIKKMGVSFALSYSIISNLNGAVSFSVAWYISCKRTGLSPLVPGQWKTLLASYGMIYGLIQILKPFRVAAAIGMSKLSAEYLELTQNKLNCSRSIAIACQYLMGQVVMVLCASLGVGIVSLLTGVPIWGR